MRLLEVSLLGCLYATSQFALLLFSSSFSWRFNSCKKVYVLYDKDILLVIFSREILYKFMTWRFHLLHFPLKFLLIFSFWFLRLFSLLFPSLWFIILGLFCSPFLGYLTPSCVRFLNYFEEGEEFLSYFKEGEETFCSLNVVFSWGMLGWGK